METLSIFLKIVFDNLKYILPIFIVLLAITFVGVNIILTIIDEKRWDIILPAGVAVGIFGFIFLLGNLSYFLKGRSGIAIIFAAFVFLGILLFRKNKAKVPKFELNYYYKRTLFVFFLLGGFLLFLVGATQYGGDTYAYWGFAASFANGNYPLRSLWQPDILANHHQGTYMFEGAIQALTGVDMLLVHTLYAWTVIMAGIFLIWGFVKKISKKEFVSFLPPLVAYFSFGAIFLPIPRFFRIYIVPEVEHIIDRLPLLIDAKDRLGGTSTLPLFVYVNHRAAAFLGFLLILFLIYSKLKIKSFFKPTLVAALSIAVISSDEIFLPAILFCVFGWFVKEIITKKEERKKTILSFILAGVAGTILFFSVGNALRDSLLTPPKEDSRFQFVVDAESFLKRQNGLKSAILWPKEQGTYFWILPGATLIAFVALVVGAFSGNFWIILLLFSVVGTFVAYFVVDHTYYPSNNDRFLHLIYQLLGLIIASSLVLLLNNKKKLVKYLAAGGIIILLIPGVLFSSIFLFRYSKQPYYPNLKGTLPDYDILKWAQKNIPDKRMFFIDGYLRGQPYSYLTLNGIQNYGLFVPISPVNTKVHTPDYGFEAIDLINTLNPTPLRQLKVEYLFIVKDQTGYYSKQRQSDLTNPNYFTPDYEDKLGTLYKVNDRYFGEAQDEGSTISNLPDLVPDGGNIYIDYPPRLEHYIRAVMTLVLKDEGKLYTEWRSGTFNLIETKIELAAPSLEVKYDYLVLGPDTDPSEICRCGNFTKIWEIDQAKAYKIQ